MLDRKDGAYGVVLCELFPPQKDKKVHQLVFKYETKKSKLTIEKWKKIFQKCNILDDFYEAVRKHAGQEPWSKYNKVSLPLDFFSLSSSLTRLVVAASRLAVDLFRQEKSRKTSGTRVIFAKHYTVNS